MDYKILTILKSGHFIVGYECVSDTGELYKLTKTNVRNLIISNRITNAKLYRYNGLETIRVSGKVGKVDLGDSTKKTSVEYSKQTPVMANNKNQSTGTSSIIKAKQYMSKLKTLGVVGVEIDIRGENDIRLIRVPDGEGTFIIPDFITSVYNDGESYSHRSAFENTRYETIVVKSTMFNYTGLCSYMLSRKIKVAAPSNVTPKSLSKLFFGCINLDEVDISSINISNLQCIDYIFGGCNELKQAPAELLRAPKLEDMVGAFSGCANLQSINTGEIVYIHIKDISHAFEDCISLTDINVDRLGKCPIKSCYKAFYNTAISKIDITELKFLNDSKCSSDLVFGSCERLRAIKIDGNCTSLLGALNSHSYLTYADAMFRHLEYIDATEVRVDANEIELLYDIISNLEYIRSDLSRRIKLKLSGILFKYLANECSDISYDEDDLYSDYSVERKILDNSFIEIQVNNLNLSDYIKLLHGGLSEMSIKCNRLEISDKTENPKELKKYTLGKLIKMSKTLGASEINIKLEGYEIEFRGVRPK